ncbi:MAG TPA: lipopolysaccharide transport periplasmic protein LptA [Steroidobacteraceae bacterium]
MRAIVLLLAATASLGADAAQLEAEEISIAFDFSEIDTRRDEHHLRGNVRISQGPIFIVSEEAKVEGAFQSEDSRWTFQGNVHVHTNEADLRADTATAHIMDGAIANAVVTGSPAVFERTDPTNQERVDGRAGRIEYDFTKGVIRLSDDVQFSYDGNEFRGAVVVYYVRDDRVVVNPEGQNQGRVNITIRPRPGEKLLREERSKSPEGENVP